MSACLPLVLVLPRYHIHVCLPVSLTRLLIISTVYGLGILYRYATLCPVHSLLIPPARARAFSLQRMVQERTILTDLRYWYQVPVEPYRVRNNSRYFYKY